MTSFTVLDINELQREIIRSIEYFSQLSRIRVVDNDFIHFIQEKLYQISRQGMEFRRFAEKSISQSLIMCSYAEDLIVFAENVVKMMRQVESVKNSLGGIANEIFEYNEKITENEKIYPIALIW
ncbi:hypothetical protein C1646_765288 [Rhizophagus diaphanus]|nr:hypothetical protein C1646_765288 [Rhizophagus diaphanus] [Rhizophagus sp. MUCL 43196]